MAKAAIACYHSALIAGWVPKWWVPCGTGPSCSEQSLEILGGIQIPWLSLAAFIAIVILLFVYLRKDPFMNAKKFTIIGLVAIVALFFYWAGGMNASARAGCPGSAGQGRADPPGAHAPLVLPPRCTGHHRRVP